MSLENTTDRFSQMSLEPLLNDEIPPRYENLDAPPEYSEFLMQGEDEHALLRSVPQHQRVMQAVGTAADQQWPVPSSSVESQPFRDAKERFERIHHENIKMLPEDPILLSRRDKRIWKELNLFRKLDIPRVDFVTCAPLPHTNNRQILCSLLGPEHTPYEGGIFHVMFIFTDIFNPPIIRFLTKVYHPNIDARGKICCDILDEMYSPCLTIYTMMISIVSILSDPSVDDPLVPEIASTLVQDQQLYERNARVYTRKYAMTTTPSQDEARVIADMMLEEHARR